MEAYTQIVGQKKISGARFQSKEKAGDLGEGGRHAKPLGGRISSAWLNNREHKEDVNENWGDTSKSNGLLSNSAA